MKKKTSSYNAKVRKILMSLEKYHTRYYSKKKFFGPTLFFHNKALKKTNLQCEYIYATLSSWGMHRMGKGGAKMTEFKIIKKSINHIQKEIQQLRSKKLESLKEKDFEKLEKIFRTIKVMESKTTIVGNSKVMAHLLPNIIPPIDRQYTFRYLKKSTSNLNNIDKEWVIFKIFIQDFFQKLSSDNNFKICSTRWRKNIKKYPWDTSVPKIIDNLIIAATPKRKSKK